MNAYSDKLVKLLFVLQFSVAVQEQCGVVSVGLALLVEYLNIRNTVTECIFDREGLTRTVTHTHSHTHKVSLASVP